MLESLLVGKFTDMTAGGLWVEDHVVQGLLIDLLRRTERENGWPWGFVRNQVVQAWRPM
jgi:hypothetical protein